MFSVVEGSAEAEWRLGRPVLALAVRPVVDGVGRSWWLALRNNPVSVPKAAVILRVQDQEGQRPLREWLLVRVRFSS